MTKSVLGKALLTAPDRSKNEGERIVDRKKYPCQFCRSCKAFYDSRGRCSAATTKLENACMHKHADICLTFSPNFMRSQVR